MYAVGIEVPPRHGASFSLHYGGRRFSNIYAARCILRLRLLKKKIGTYGEIRVANWNTKKKTESFGRVIIDAIRRHKNEGYVVMEKR